MNKPHRVFARARPFAGFALLEGLIAMLVMAFGILALVSLQSAFRTSSDESKLRTEATRLAQQKLDQLRAFEQVAADVTKVTYLGDVVNSTAAEVINLGAYSNTTFSRTWTATPSTSGMHRTVTVNVAWDDRRGAQQLALSSVIGRADPAAISTLGVGPGSTVVRRPKNRNINIPYPAKQLAGNKSAFQPPGGTTAVIVFDNNTGDVLGTCPGPTFGGLTFDNLGETSVIDLAADGCNSDKGYLLSGYVRFCTSSTCGPGTPTGTDKYAYASNATLALDSVTPLQLVATNQTSGTPTLTCFSARQVTLNNSTTVLDSGQADNQIASRFISYACIVYPVDHDSAPTTPLRWWGRVTLKPGAGWVIGTSAGQYKVCRFTGDYNANGLTSNAEHPLWYRGVTGALDSQNYLVIPQNDDCPTDQKAVPVSGDFLSSNTATHQTGDPTVMDGGVLSFTCTTIACSGGAKITAGLEASIATNVDLKME